MGKCIGECLGKCLGCLGKCLGKIDDKMYINRFLFLYGLDDEEWLNSLIVNTDGQITGYENNRGEYPEEAREQEEQEEEEGEEENEDEDEEEQEGEVKEEEGQGGGEGEGQGEAQQQQQQAVFPNHNRNWNIFNSRDLDIDHSVLLDIEKRWLKKPKEAVRRLLKALIGEARLREMTLTGRNGRHPIPMTVIDAILGKSENNFIVSAVTEFPANTHISP